MERGEMDSNFTKIDVYDAEVAAVKVGYSSVN